MEGQARQGPTVLSEPRQLTNAVPAARLLLVAAGFTVVYVTCVPAAFFLVMAVFTWQLFHWLLLSVLLVPALIGLGLFGLVKGLIPTGLLIGAVAARTPDLHWPKLLAAATVPLVDLFLLRASVLPHLIERGSLMLMDHRALFMLDTIAPAAASMLVTLAVPQRLVRRLLGRQRVYEAPAIGSQPPPSAR